MVREEVETRATVCPVFPNTTRDERTPVGTTRRWMVLHTRSRQEKAVARHLSARGVDHILPLVRKTAFHGRRKLYSETPLFPGYVFLRGFRDDAYSAIESKRVCQILDVPDQGRFERELSQICRVLQSGLDVIPYPAVAVGTRCEVIRGPFKGLQGIVIAHGRAATLVLEVHILGQGAVVQVDSDVVAPLN